MLLTRRRRRPFAFGAARPDPAPEAGPTPRVFAALAPLLLPALPARMVERGAALLLRRLARAEPRLIAALAALPPTRIGIAAAELPYRLVLGFGGAPISLRRPAIAASGAGEPPPDATMAGRLGALIALLEGRIDGDALFFARDLTVTGNSAAVVALRNTLDRHAIDLAGTALGLLGPFARPARAAGRRLDLLGAALRTGFEQAHLAHHAKLAAAAPPPGYAPGDSRGDTPGDSMGEAATASRAELRRLASRLARLERRGAAPTEPPTA